MDDKTAELQNLAQLHSQGAHGRGVRRGEGETAGNLAPAVPGRGPGRGVHQTGGVYDEIVVDPCHGAWASFLDQLWSDDEHGVHNVLDVCCGTGLLAGELAALGYQVVGLDGSEAMLARARRRVGSEVRLVRSTLPHWPSKAYTTPRSAPLTALTTSLRPISARRSRPCPFASARPDGSSSTCTRTR